MIVTNQTTADIYFGPLHLAAGVGQTLAVDDTSATSLYLTEDVVADALNNAYNAGKVTVSGQAQPFPRPTGVPQVLHGDGNPEGLVYAPQGSVYLRRDGTGANTLYVKTTGITINTGWLQLGSAAGGPGTEWDYAQTTSNTTVSAGSEATATTVVTGNTVTYDGTAVIVEFYAPFVYPAPNDIVSFWLYLDGSSIAHLGLLYATPTTGNGMGAPVALRYKYTPTAGGHTFSVRASRNGTNGTVYAGAGGQGVYVPAYLRVTKA